MTLDRGRESSGLDGLQRVIRSPEEVFAAAAAIPRTVPLWQGQEGPVWRLTISPGSVQIGSRDYGRINKSTERRLEAALRQNEGMTLELDRTISKRGNITAMTDKSRAAMTRRLCTLDYTPLFNGDRTPVMVTLTLPHDWEAVAGTAQSFKAIVDRFRSSYRYAWGDIIRGVWKMEFQYRKACAAKGCHDPRAPHLHILTVAPEGGDRLKGRPFAEWLSLAWTQAIRPSKVVDEGRAHVDGLDVDGKPCSCSEWCRSLSAGTGIDYEETLRYGDAKRIAVYFTKHGTFGNKAYQNDMPEAWRAAELGGARFWGVWGLRPAEGVQETDERTAVKIARHLRKLQESQSYVRSETVWRTRPARATSSDIDDLVDELSSEVDGAAVAGSGTKLGIIGTATRKARKLIVTESGELRELYPRTVRRRVRYMRGHRGFLSVNDGVSVAADIARLVAFYNDLDGFLDPPDAMVPLRGREAHEAVTARGRSEGTHSAKDRGSRS